jgi:hypothetical protein
MGITVTQGKCYERRCKHFQGTAMGHDFCAAFPDGVPDEIAHGENQHTAPLQDQGNGIVFEAFEEGGQLR